MLVTLNEIKTYLNITDTSQDDWLLQQEALLSETVESYCGRKFLQDEYIQHFYKDEICGSRGSLTLELFHYPAINVSEILEGSEDDILLGDTDITALVRVHKPTGGLKNLDGFFVFGDIIRVTYEAGYAQDKIPQPIKSVILSLIQERYSKKQSGVNLSFGSDVQRISIPGTISIDFDYSLNSNERSSAFGTILGNHINVLDSYRSERVIIGSGDRNYIEEAP
jgi:hypothetical protein